MAAKPSYAELRRALGGYKSHLTRTCDSNARLVDLANNIGAVAAPGLSAALVTLDERLDKCNKQIDLMLGVCDPKDYDAVEALKDPLYKQYDDNRVLVLECLATLGPAAAAAAYGGGAAGGGAAAGAGACLLYTSPSPRDKRQSRMPSSA